MKILLRIFLVSFFAGLFFIASKNFSNVSAQAATVQCQIANVVFDGTDHPYGTFIPLNKDFSLKITCLPGFSSPKDVSVTFGGVTKTLNGLTAMLSTQIGIWNFSSPPSPSSDKLTIIIPGEIVTCGPNCTVTIQVPPIATPLPGPNCLAFRDYSPTSPTINQQFQIQFNLNGTNISNGVGRYKIDYTVKGSSGGSLTPTDASATFGIWFVTIPAVDGQVKWDVLFDGVKCGTSSQLFDGITSGGFGSGRNPCTIDGCVTALGTIPTSIAGFATTFLSIAIGLAGGIALILMVLGAIQVLTSSGNQQNLNAGKDRLVAAVAGLLFLIFSALILRFIGLNILGGIV